MVAGSSISAEKDRRTFVLLLMTDLTNREIILGKLLSSLLQMAVLLASALPVFLICMLLGGASLEQIGRIFAVTTSAALATGSLGVLIASWREKTFQAVALTVLVIVLYLVAAESGHSLIGDSRLFGLSGEAWRAAFNPFASINAVMEPALRDAAPWVPMGRVEWLLVALMLVLTAVFSGIAIVQLRVWNPGGGKPTQAREPADELERRLARSAHDQPDWEARPIWDNPVLWREVRTRAYGRRPLVIKLNYLLTCGLIAVGLYLAARDNPLLGRLDLAKAVVPIVVTSLILINAQAVTSITSERDIRALDLLLVTDVTPKEFIFGKILGVLYNAKEMVVLPIGLGVYLFFWGHVGTEVWAYMVFGFLVLSTFAISLGLHSALAYDKTRSAVLVSQGIIAFLFIGIMVSIFLILVSSRFESQLVSFFLFMCAGAVGLYVSLGVRNPSSALFWVAISCPFMTWWSIAQFLQDRDPLGYFLAIVICYGFAVLAMLIPAVSEFDVALGRTVAEEG
jgi:ABC-type Na+ efflux pump permease subunit